MITKLPANCIKYKLTITRQHQFHPIARPKYPDSGTSLRGTPSQSAVFVNTLFPHQSTAEMIVVSFKFEGEKERRTDGAVARKL